MGRKTGRPRGEDLAVSGEFQWPPVGRFSWPPSETWLVVTLERFLAHHGSTTDTAAAMKLHRHTVGYRLARIHEVSGLSPHQSEGRERLSLGLKARRLLLAEERARQRAQA